MPDIYIPTGSLTPESHGAIWSLPHTGYAVNTTLVTELGPVLDFDLMHFAPQDESQEEAEPSGKVRVVIESGVATVPLGDVVEATDEFGMTVQAPPDEAAAFLDAMARAALLRAGASDLREIHEERHEILGLIDIVGVPIALKVAERLFGVRPPTVLELAIGALSIAATYPLAAYGKDLAHVPAAVRKYMAVRHLLKDRPLIIYTGGEPFTRPRDGTPVRQSEQTRIRALRPGTARA